MNKYDIYSLYADSDDQTVAPRARASFGAEWTCTHPDGTKHLITRVLTIVAPEVPGRYFIEVYPFIDSAGPTFINSAGPTPDAPLADDLFVEDRTAPPARYMLLVSTVTT